VKAKHCLQKHIALKSLALKVSFHYQVVFMFISELTKKIQKAAETRTHAERIELLRQANIIDNDGYYHKDFFSAETVAKDKSSRTNV
jgi:hypothetical protein